MAAIVKPSAGMLQIWNSFQKFVNEMGPQMSVVGKVNLVIGPVFGNSARALDEMRMSTNTILKNVIVID